MKEVSGGRGVMKEVRWNCWLEVEGEFGDWDDEKEIGWGLGLVEEVSWYRSVGEEGGGGRMEEISCRVWEVEDMELSRSL